MWLRNLFFLGVILAGAATLMAALFPEAQPKRAPHFQLAEFESAGIRANVRRVNDILHKQWSSAKIEIAPRAPDLTIARRLSLGLVPWTDGTHPLAAGNPPVRDSA
jgi:hypothetical protein